ncbi:hypothetical protein [Nocardia salmonicida]
MTRVRPRLVSHDAPTAEDVTDGDECRLLDGLGTAVDAGTEVMIIPSVAGG